MTTTQKSPVDMLAEIGRALHGELWQRPLARDLGVHERQLRRWITEESPLPADHGIFPELRELLRRRAQVTAATAETLDQWMGAGHGR